MQIRNPLISHTQVFSRIALPGGIVILAVPVSVGISRDTPRAAWGKLMGRPLPHQLSARSKRMFFLLECIRSGRRPHRFWFRHFLHRAGGYNCRRPLRAGMLISIFFLPDHLPLAIALRARIYNDLAFTMTVRTGRGHVDHLAKDWTGVTRLISSAALTNRATAALGVPRTCRVPLATFATTCFF